MSEKLPAGYVRCMNQMKRAIPAWIELQSRERALDLQWHPWGKTIFALGLDQAKYLAASPDAVALLTHLEEVTNKQGTLLQAKVVLEVMGIKAREDH